jgi:Domain of unknown function (DUF397)
MTGDPMTQSDSFRKSSYSVSQGACVEVGSQFPGLVVIRDSKHTDGTRIPVSPIGWRQFVSQVKLARCGER